MEIKKGTTDVSRYVSILDSTAFTPETGVTITDLDLQYTRSGAAPAAKVDATALGSTDAAHADNKMIEVDGASSPGLYRVDWPDAAFASGVESVTLVVTGAGFAPAVEHVQLVDNVVGDALDGSDRVDVGAWIGTAVTLGSGAPDVNIQSTDDIDLSATQKASVNTEADTAIETYGLDHLVAVADADDVVDDSVIAKLASKGGTADWSDFDNATDSLEAIRDDMNPHRIFSGTSTGSSTSSKVYVQAGDPPSGGVDDDYNDTLILVWDGASKATARLNVRGVSDYDDSDPSFTLDSALGFTPGAGDLVEVYAADTATLAALAKLTTGFGTSAPDTLEGYLRSIISKAASAPAAAGTFDPATDSVEAIRELADNAVGAGFSTGTDSLTEIRDAIDTLVAPAVVGSSAMSGAGFLSDCVTLIRKMTDEPSVSPKYTDAEIVDFLQAAFATVITDLNVNTDHPVVVRYNITLESGKQNYTLPPNVGEVWRIAKLNTTSGLPEYEMWPDNHFSPGQAGIVIEGNTLRLLRDWKSTDTLEVLFVPLGEPLIHYGTAEAVTAGTITLMAVPTDGTLDTRANAYAGYLVRVLTSTGPAGHEAMIRERLITAYDNVTRVATLAEDWDTLPTGTITYEVVPQYSLVLKHLVCLSAALDILAIEASTKRLQTLQTRFVTKQRAMRLMIERKCGRFPGHAEGDTSDNENRGAFLAWG